MRNDAALLLDMLIAARKIVQFSADLTKKQFENSELHQSAVIRELQVIGEAARLISEPTKSSHTEIAWPVIAGMRNRIVHEYFRIDLDLLWDVTQEDIPTLIEQLKPLIPPET
jgi:uncharacterized protein with HEPN domain